MKNTDAKLILAFGSADHAKPKGDNSYQKSQAINPLVFLNFFFTASIFWFPTVIIITGFFIILSELYIGALHMERKNKLEESLTECENSLEVYAFTDINCSLGVKLFNGSFKFFNTIDDLNKL